MNRILFAVVFLFALPALAATWRVERGGSGDFMVIQDAVNAAASGDSILLGPGRFDEHGPFMPGTVTIYDAYVGVDDISLTFIGSGQGVTIVGPAVAPSQTLEIGFVLAAESAQTVRIESLTLENLDKGLTAEVVRVLCQDVEFRDSETGAFLYQSVQSSFLQCEFSSNPNGITAIPGSHGLQITDCIFTAAYWHAVNFGQSLDLLVRDCQILNSRFGVYVNQGASATLERCTIQVNEHTALRVESNSTAELTEVVLSSGSIALSVSGNSAVVGSQNVFEGGLPRTMEFLGLSTSGLHFNDIRKGAGPAIYVDFYLTPVDIDLRNNFWGTTDPDSIAAWIIDSNDNHNPPLDPNYGTVLYEPFLLQSVPVEQKSMGSLKALFERRRD